MRASLILSVLFLIAAAFCGLYGFSASMADAPAQQEGERALALGSLALGGSFLFGLRAFLSR